MYALKIATENCPNNKAKLTSSNVFLFEKSYQLM